MSSRHVTTLVAAVGLLLSTLGQSPAQVAYPPKPDKYDVQLRYRIRAARDQRIVEFEAMAKHLKALGLVHADEKAFELELLDPAAELVKGTIPAAGVVKLFADPNIKTALLLPAGTNLRDDPEKAVHLRIDLAGGLLAREQKALHGQAADQLAKMGFVQVSSYDHVGYTRLRGTLPAGKVAFLLKDLRSLPPGWITGGTDRDDLPLPLRSVLAIKLVEVLPDLPVAPPLAALTDLGKLTADLKAVVADPATATSPLVVEAVMEYETAGFGPEIRDKLRLAIPGVLVEGFAGSVATLRLPQASMLEKVTAYQDVRSVRLPRTATETLLPAAPGGDFVTTSQVKNLHDLGYKGGGVTVVVVGSEFPGVETKPDKGADGKEFLRLTLAGVTLPRGSRLFDLTGEVSPTLEPKPADTTRGGAGTAAALAAHAAAPDAAITLVRIDPSRFHQLLTVAKAVSGAAGYSTAMTTRSDELSVRAATLDARRRAASNELTRAFSDLSDDEKQKKRRDDAAAAMKQVQADEADLKKRFDRFLGLQTGLDLLRGSGVVVNTLVWEAGHPHDAQSELSKLIESAFAVGGVPTGLRAIKKPATPAWVQAGGVSVGSVWSGPFLDADANGVMEFAAAGVPLPAKRWTRELNFLGHRTADGKTTTALPAGLKLRVSVQWREPHNPDVVLPSEPSFPIRLRLFKQLDPDGKTVASDEMAEVARSVGETVRLYKSAGSGVYEATLEATTADGVYALRVDGGAADLDLPPSAKVAMELRPRIVVELTDPTQATKGQVVFDSFAVQNSGVGVPGDSPAAVTVGTAKATDPTAAATLTGVGPGVALGEKPDVLTEGTIAVSGKPVSGTAVAAGYTGGLAACLMEAGVRPSDLMKSIGLKPGSPLVLPPEWLQSLRAKPSR